ncbi:MAG: hypothetical protein DRH12_02675 [Deltaproteobacteria bacterium]|nr:MAG: hypothetical protein DRH12_02675 [Deltaproteobacteria bacterium]RLB79260.1 MAG: hypothetical protein DRH15_09165 [Deltaproteobacteria bacterium]
MAKQKILVPYDLRHCEKRVLDFLINSFSSSRDIALTLFHCYAPLPEIDTDSSAVLGRLQDTMRSLKEELRKKESGLKWARTYLLKSGFSNEQVDYIFKPLEKDISYEIIEVVQSKGYDMIVLCRSPGRIARLLGRSVSYKLLSTLKDVAVCIIL